MLNEPRHLLGRNLARGNDQVALILPRLVIQHNHKFALGNVAHYRIDAVEHRHQSPLRNLLPKERSHEERSCLCHTDKSAGLARRRPPTPAEGAR